MILEKECSECHQIKPISEFYKGKQLKYSMFAIGNNELNELPVLKKLIYCDRCKHKHRIQYAKDKYGSTNHTIAFIHCDDGEDYLVGVAGKDIRSKFREE